MSKATGGPAFPRPFSIDDVDPDITYPAHAGMTLRDYFAAKALSGLVVNGDNFNLTRLTAYSYEIADAMLKAREA